MERSSEDFNENSDNITEGIDLNKWQTLPYWSGL